jgi:hypothetical protein
MLSQHLTSGTTHRTCPPQPPPLTSYESTMTGYRCFDEGCASKPDAKVYRNQQSLRQHQRRKHADTKAEDTLMGRTLGLKREHEAEMEEARKRRQLEEEMARCTPEPEPPCPVGFKTILIKTTPNTIPHQWKRRFLSWRDQSTRGSHGR